MQIKFPMEVFEWPWPSMKPGSKVTRACRQPSRPGNFYLPEFPNSENAAVLDDNGVFERAGPPPSIRVPPFMTNQHPSVIQGLLRCGSAPT